MNQHRERQSREDSARDSNWETEGQRQRLERQKPSKIAEASTPNVSMFIIPIWWD